MSKKVILITGASSGMGKVSARKLLQEGHCVYVVARRLDLMQDLEVEGAIAMKMDITNNDEVKQVVDTIIQKEGKIDVLWNNAGYGLFGPVENVSIDQARYQFEVNLFGLAHLTQLVLPHMRSQRSGTIINTSSVGGKVYTPLGAWYHATKHALEGFSDCLRLEVKQFNIHVVLLEPGIIETEFADVLEANTTKLGIGEAYRSFTDTVLAASRKIYEPGKGSKPDVIANTISKIVRSTRPKTRYRVGKLAKPIVWMRLYLGDRIYDKLVMRFL